MEIAPFLYLATFAVIIALIAFWPVIVGVIWTVQFLRTEQHSLKELFWLVGYWAFFFAVYSGAWMIRKP
jgi:hypothetical protein